jgi:hypothetical protein
VHHNTLHLQRVDRRNQTKKGRKEKGKKERKIERESTIDVVRQWAVTDAIPIVGDCQATQRNISEDLDIGSYTCLGNMNCELSDRYRRMVNANNRTEGRKSVAFSS